MPVPYIVTISSDKGGVGKTTLATNLAIYLKALHEDLPVTLLSFDNHFSVDRMFRINGQQKGDVAGLFSGAPPDDLVETGEYGVQFIPSSSELSLLRRDLDDPSILAKNLAGSDLGGIMIIDTRPDLDIFTQSALYASDRVIVPVKDAPSLENCRHIYDFFDNSGLSRRPLRILPCLIDGRIHYDEGPFRDPYQLLKAYAINRGYRCMEGYIAKSPKVESLNTNPEGKIYPVLTHGRQTDVHIQLSHVARQVYLDIKEKQGRRLNDVCQNVTTELAQRQSAYEARLEALNPNCLVCNTPLVHADHIDAAGYFAQSSGKSVSGFVEEECFTGLVFRYFYSSKKAIEASDPLWDLFRESAQRSYFVLRRAPHTRNYYQQKLSFYRFDESGLEVSHKTIELQEYDKRLLSKEKSELFRLLERTLFDSEGRLGEDFLLLRKVSTDLPEELLFDQNFESFASIMAKVSAQLPE